MQRSIEPFWHAEVLSHSGTLLYTESNEPFWHAILERNNEPFWHASMQRNIESFWHAEKKYFGTQRSIECREVLSNSDTLLYREVMRHSGML